MYTDKQQKAIQAAIAVVNRLGLRLLEARFALTTLARSDRPKSEKQQNIIYIVCESV